MARKYDLISELYNRTCKTVVANPQNWQAFLRSACRNYKLRYDEQLLVYAQRPDATAVLEIERWNTRFGRWVNRGAKGIAVFEDANRERQRLTHYFDISDTHGSRYSRPVPLWEMKEEYESDIIETLESTFGTLDNKINLAEAIMSASRNATEDNIPDYISDLLYSAENSFLEGLDDDMITSLYKSVVTNSVAYMMMSRLGLDTEYYFENSDFSDVTNFNTQDTLNALGFASSDIAEMGLTEIAKTIAALDRENRIIADKSNNEYNEVEKETERSFEDGQTDLHDGGRLQPTEFGIAGTTGSESGQIRTDEEEISEGTPQGSVLQFPDERHVDDTLSRSGTESNRDGGNSRETDGSERGSNRADESDRYDVVGSDDEQSEERSSGNREDGSGIRLSDDVKPLPSVNQQLSFLDTKAEEKETSAFVIPQEVIDDTLSGGSGFENGKMRIYEQFQKSLSTKENAEFLKKEYGIGGASHSGGHDEYQNWHDAKGIRITKGYAENRPQVLLNWNKVATRISELIRMDRYLNAKQKEEYPKWLEEQEIKRAEAEERRKNRELLSIAPDEKVTDSDGDLVGKEVTIDDHLFVIESVGKISGDVSLRDVTFQNANGFPINRVEKIGFIRNLLEQQNLSEEKVAEQPSEAKYEYHLGDMVYIGASQYEILSFDENRVMLYDFDIPLFNKEMTREEFDRKVRENPMNDHLIAKEQIQEDKSAESVDNFSDFSPNVNYEDAFFTHPDGSSIVWMYYNPDSEAGGQYVTNFVSVDDVKEAARSHNEPEKFFDYLGSIARQELADIGTEWFKGAEIQFAKEPTFTDCTKETMDNLIGYAMMEQKKSIASRLVDFVKDVDFYEYQDNIEFGETDEETIENILSHLSDKSYVEGVIEYLKQMKENIEDEPVYRSKVDRLLNDVKELLPEEPIPVYDRESEILYAVLHALKIDDIELDYDADGLVARDDDYEWHGADFYHFLIDEAFVFEDDGSVLGIRPELLTDFRALSEHNGVECKVKNGYVATNIGNVPVEDYREIVAMQNGFDSYDEMYQQGIRIGNGYDKEPEPIVPAWEQQKKSKVRSFDLHPEIPMADRHTFDLKANEVESVGKKERFRRNMEAIRVLKECEFENRFATPEEQIVLSKYVGWGGIPEAFDENNGAWANEFTELYAALSPEEYASARESTLTAFYTPPEVITAIYKAMEQMGFKEGNLLEPSCGIGHFIGMLPDSMKDSKIYGVELDTISAGIAQQLYQKTSIAAQGFEETNVPDSFFDGVIGNVPFGDFKVSDKRYDKHKFLIHDYFFAKSLDKLRPGGVLALVTSKGTMDKENSAVRKYIAQRAELLGAIRLPNNTFKGNAGTEVVSDILILQKRDRIVDIEPDWVHLDTDENGIKMNSYFVQHPEMILGEMKMVSGRFGMEATCEPYENADLTSQLDEAISNIHGEITAYEVDEELAEEDNSIPADPTVRNFSYTLLDDTIYFRENSRMTPIDVSATAENRIKGMIKIRDSVRTLIELQTEDYPDYDIKAEQANLNRLYDEFTKKYGLINSRANISAFSQDSSFSLLSALEIIGEDGTLERKADMFFKRTIKPHTPITSVDTSSEALAVSMGEKAFVDMEYMQELTGKTEQEIFEDLKGVIFLNPLYEYGNHPESKYLMADEYLSGNVREKLTIAKKSAQLYPDDYTVNVEALEKVQPKDLTASEISVRLGATWLPPDIVEKFIFEFLDTPRYAQWNIKVHFSPFTSEWNIENKAYDRANVKAYSTYGTSRINAYKIIEETLNLKDVRIFDYIEDEEGKKKAVLNKKETAIAQAKQELIKQGFQDWVWADPTRREKLTKLYNEKFNSIRPREYDGSHITFNGMNPEIELRDHQRNAVAHILYGGNTLLAHAVGAGKTFEMVAAAQESKRLGLCNKSLFVVPNHLTEQWAAEYLQLYPSANILVATKKDFETKNRKKFCGRIATGDYDAVIIGHSQFEKIPMSIERQRAILEQQLDEITEGIADLKRNRGEKFSVKQLEKSKKSIKQKLDKLNDQTRKDDVVTFEELGVDRLFIDESHYYKNLYLYTKMRNVGGIAQTEAQKSSDLFMKCRYLDEITGGRGTIFATGTPISNSMVELYTIQRYLQYNTLQRNGLQHFDAWASTFGETVTAVELTPEGTGYRAKTRFAKFYNLPELMAMFKEVADIKTADMLDLPVPEAKYHNIAVKPSEMQKEMVAALAERAEAVRGGGVDSSVDNMLKITNDGRKLALDQRMINGMLPDFEGSKINACVDNIYRIWEENTDKKSAQLVFCDLSTPKSDGTFSVYNDIRAKLIERGIPSEEIKFIHEADTDIKKKELFQKTRKGEVRVLLGSTQKMGAGTNVQDRLIALHDVDCPWRPSDLEQRSGRIIRQGNSNPEVEIYRYVTEQTFDAYLYQLVEGKQKFASQIMTSKSPVRSAEDIDETALSYAEIKMLATGNPYIKEKMDLDIQVQKLRLLKSNFLSEKYALEDKIIKYYPQRIAALKTRLDGLTKDVETAKQHPKPEDDRFIGMMVSGVSYSEKADAGQAILEVCKTMTSPDPIPLGEYRGFQMEILFDTVERNYVVRLKGETSRNVPLGEDIHGNITRIDNGIERFAETLADTRNELENTKNQFETAKKEVEKPFVKEEELKAKTARLDELNILLNMDKRENEIVGGEPDEGDDVPVQKSKDYER